MSKSSCKTIKLEAYRLDKDRTLAKEKLKSLTERLESGRADNRSCVARTCEVSLERSHLVDYGGNTAL